MRRFLALNLLFALPALAVACGVRAGEQSVPPVATEARNLQPSVAATPAPGVWKQFASEERGFEFRYPENGTV